MKKLLAAVAVTVFGLFALGTGGQVEAAESRTVAKASAKKKVAAAKSKRKATAAKKVSAKKRLSKRKVSKRKASKRKVSKRASRRASQRAAKRSQVARLPQARSAPGALSMPRLPDSGGDERSLAPRAYAMDGATFYQGGKRIRVKGIDARAAEVSSEHAKQRLQRLLDSGRLQVEPVAADKGGNTLSVVRVNGRDVADMVRTN